MPHPGLMKHVNVSLALALHCLVGAGFLVAAQFADFDGPRAGIAALLWFGGAFFQLDWREKSPGGIWLVPVLWPFAAWNPVLGALVLVGGLVWIAAQSRTASAARPAPIPASARERKLRAVESTLATLEAQLRDLLEPPLPVPSPPAAALPPPPPPAPARRRSPFERELDWSDLLGARALAWAGGIVTILGILFFFVLAANRGWLLPEIRLALGATTSTAVFASGFWVRRRFGALHSAVAAAGAGIAGAFGTLLAATALYGFVPEHWALVAAAAIAAAGATTALAWSSQTVAAIGLLGAMLVPLMVLADERELSFVGTAFAALVLAGTAVVSLRTGWRDLLLLAGGASLVQIAVLTAETDGMSWSTVGLAGGFWLLYLGIGIAWQLLHGRRALEPVSGVFVIAGGALAAYACLFLLDRGAGYALLAVAGVYAVLAAAFLRLPGYRDFASSLGAVAAVVAAIAAAELLAGASLALVWSSVAVLLAWLARRAREPRLLLVSGGYCVLAVGHALVLDAPPRALFVAGPHPGSGTLALVAAGGALALFAYFARDLQHMLLVLWPAAVLLIYAASLGILELLVRVASFDWGHVGLAGLWIVIALALVTAGARVGRWVAEAGLVLLAATWLEVVSFDAPQLADGRWEISFLVAAGGAALAGLEYGRRASFAQRLLPAALAALGGAVLALGGVDALAAGSWHGISIEGGALVLVAAAYLGLALPVFRSHRDLATVYWSLGLLAGSFALPSLLSHVWLILAGAVSAGALALLGRYAREFRLELAAGAAFALTTAAALVEEATPSDLFVASAHPAAGATAILALIGAAVVGAVGFTRSPFRLGAVWTSGVLALYAASLGVLELFVRIADFDWGHVALAGLWAVAALALLETGLRLERLELQVAAAGLLVFTGLEAGAYDWVELPATKAALTSLVLAAGFLGAAFEYGRLARLRERLLPAGLSLTASVALASAGVLTLAGGSWHGIDVEGGALILAGVVYTTSAALVLRRERDLATCLWVVGLCFGLAGLAVLLSGFWLVLAGVLVAVGLWGLAELVGETRLQLAGLIVLAGTLGYALGTEAPPRDFFAESAHPGRGVPALLLVVAGALVVVWRAAGALPVRTAALAVVGAVSFYAVSLGLLELAESATAADVATKFQRGHTAVSVFWGLLSLALLYLGLTRRSRQLRVAGFALFGVSLAKLFLYDLAYLSSLTRALSFLAVGVFLLFSGFFYQRLSEQLQAKDGAGRPSV
ncbi:MAG TPA: DUF2339 domain-containing protein [Gaiellaceae bacterium]|nr:DUF2339 domain-containing protein [Gaiellaceae bacterium]